MNDGDWICSDPNCGNINFARRVSCYRCNKERPDGGKPSKKKLGTEIGKSAAEKSRGLFNADDWQCNKCANVNWARRQTCNVCNAPKFGEVEARTGYGGGYNERGVVEYRRREPSSDDEYDEFGRKKRKRKSDTQDKVGITEGPVNKKLPPTLLQKEIKMDHVMQVPASNMSLHQSRGRDKVNGSLSDSSVCDLPPLTKVSFRRNQIQNQTSYHRQDHLLPNFKTNGSRKRFSSVGDRDHTGSSGYETGSKKINESPVIKTYNPVMENRVSSTNNDVVYKFSGPTPAEDFQVTYTIEERVKAAAFAIVYKNCKISTTKFESLFDKPAPDFKTIFGWRQRLLLTGCLVDSHKEATKNNSQDENFQNNSPNLPSEIGSRNNNIPMLSNPDEIPIISDSDEEDVKNSETIKSLPNLRQRSLSAETLLLGGIDGNIRAGGSISTEERESQARSHSTSTRHRTRSSSRDSQDSNYPDTDSENMGSKNTKARSRKTKTVRSSIHESDSDSVSYNSDDGDFLSRVYEDGRKIRRKPKRGSTPIAKISNYLSNDICNGFPGYSTVKPSEQSPLVTGNIYTTNLHNMNVKAQESIVLDTDGCSSEYVPTRLGSTAKRNYQVFRDNVKKKGYWAKGNGASIATNKSPLTSATVNATKNTPKPATETYYTGTLGYVTAPTINRSEDFTKDEFDNFSSINHYTPFDKPLMSTPRKEKVVENTSRIFDVVQSNSASKNRSIMDIFNSGDVANHSPERNNDLEKYNNIPKIYETEWDEDDDALYKNTNSIETSFRQTPSPPNIGLIAAQSPMSTMLYNTVPDQSLSVSKTHNVNIDFIKDKRDMLLDLLKEFQKVNEQNLSEDKKHMDTSQELSKTIEESNNIFNDLSSSNESHSNFLQQSKSNKEPNNVSNEQTLNSENHLKFLQRDLMPIKLSNNLINTSFELSVKPQGQEFTKTISPSKRVQVLETITIPPNSNQIFSTNLTIPPNSNQIFSTNLSQSTSETCNKKQILNESMVLTKTCTPESNIQCNKPNLPEPSVSKIDQLNISNLLSGINTNTLLLALQNLQQLQPNNSADSKQDDIAPEANNMSDSDVQHVETINLTNDEDWEKESNRDGSIERQLEKLDGSTGHTPFLSDIFDPGPVVMPSNVAKKWNINLKLPEENKNQEQTLHVNENAPLIGNFKSFALPKPILLNRLKLAVKPSEKYLKKTGEGKKNKRKKQGKAGASHDGENAEEEDEEESGDEADLSKYDLWGSDGEQGNTSNLENSENAKENASSIEVVSSEQTVKNGKSSTPETKTLGSSSKRRSRSSSSSSSSTSSSSSSHSSTQTPKNKFDDFNLNSEREGSPKGSRRKSRSRSRSPRSRSATSGGRRKSRDSRSAGESRGHESTRDKEWSRDRDRRDRSRGNRDDRKERRYSRDGPSNHYGGRGRHR